jgi:uncharacterized protein DUF5063
MRSPVNLFAQDRVDTGSGRKGEKLDNPQAQPMPFNYYSECFNPIAIPAELPVTADLADDLADIWRDLKRGLALYESGSAEAAAWEWGFHFNAHWGHHTCGALYALQTWFSQNNCDLE